MSIKARFSVQQQPVRTVQTDETVYVFICLNEQEEVETYPDVGDGQTLETYYEYDYNEIIGPASKIPVDEILANPENYLMYQYTVEPEKSLEQRIRALEQEQAQMNSIFEEVVNNG